MAAAQPPPEARSLPSPPTDGISSLAYLPTSSSTSATSTGVSTLLASSSWEGTVRIHNTTPDNPRLVTQKQMDSGPLLCLCAVPSEKEGGGDNGSVIYTGGLDGSVRRFEVDSNSVSIVGCHGPMAEGAAASNDDKHAVSCIGSIQSGGGTVVASASWDGTLNIWDLRSNTSTETTSKKAPAATVQLPGKAYGMDITDQGVSGNIIGRVVVATSGRRTCIIDIEAEGSILTARMALERESSLKYQTRVVQFFHDGTGLALGSIEGRVAIEYLDELNLDSGGKKRYAFKCHRVGDTVYPVNSIAFHPLLGTFATGGCDGTVVTWDGRNKKKLTSLPKFPTSVAAMTFNGDGSELAIASSYTFEEGEREHPRDEIYVRPMLDYEIRPKSKQ